MKEVIKTATKVSGYLKTLSHSKRLVLLCHMVECEVSVGELALRCGMREAAVSQQLMLLRKEGIVTGRREGKNVFYKLKNKEIEKIMVFLHREFCHLKGGR